MIFELPNTDTREISKTLVRARETGGQVTTSRVLTLIIVAKESDDVEAITKATTEASREHPSRVILLVSGDEDATSSLDASVSIGGDAGASELVIMRLQGEVAKHLVHVVTPLLLPDTPIVAWWPSSAPVNPSEDPIGKIAQRRITDTYNDPPADALYNRRNNYASGDSDLSWARITPWRGVVASSLDLPPHEEVHDVRVFGAAENPSVDLAAGWLANRLGVTVTRHACDMEDALDEFGQSAIPVKRVELDRPSGTMVLEMQEDQSTLALSIPGRATALVALNRRSESDCLAEELRHLDPDIAYADTLKCLNHIEFATDTPAS
ncbi:glucose-6-phosphate dehydrogenase assembly protein OpcA [Corynebacterium gerontici]|uniref:Glucose-6-phosphate dehydrogenase subunit n=1 Tax=Corynebacterium gerontici TaxID=2079234 RepID=A0A3G6J0K3_9CORY|nr:glucose-6-phosphate dehydrogenase assembly protein OpcA [Corynebacterium gerontici]AZA11482.1 Glucose-6-phosphate dehydrogenase subunit [Corynebacterium gerontici]